MFRDFLNLLLRPLRLAIRPNIGLVLKGSIDQVRQAVLHFKFLPINGVEIIGHKPPVNPSCDFLTTLRNIQYVRIFVRHLTDIHSLHSLKSLRRVQFEHVAKGQPVNLDFGALPALEDVSLEWFQGAESIFNASKLRSLSLMCYPGSSSELFGQLVNLTLLRLAACGLTKVEGLKRTPSLKWLALLRQNKLESFGGLSGHPMIGFLWIEGCPSLRTLEWIVGMNSLETLRILNCGKIGGIEEVRLLPRLRHIHIHGSVKIVAQDLSFLREMPSLESVVLKGMPDREAEYWKVRNKKYNLLRADLAS